MILGQLRMGAHQAKNAPLSEMKQRLGNHKQEGLQEGQALLKVGEQRVEENMDLPQGGQNHGIQSNLLLMLALPLGEVFNEANPLT